MALSTNFRVDFCTGECLLAGLYLQEQFYWRTLLPITQKGEEIVDTFGGEQRLE